MTEITIKSKKITKITTKLKYDQTTLRKENDHNTLTKENSLVGQSKMKLFFHALVNQLRLSTILKREKL